MFVATPRCAGSSVKHLSRKLHRPTQFLSRLRCATNGLMRLSPRLPLQVVGACVQPVFSQLFEYRDTFHDGTQTHPPPEVAEPECDRSPPRSVSARSCSSQGASGRTEYGLSSSSSDELDEEDVDDDDEDENDREAASAVDASMPCASISKCGLPQFYREGADPIFGCCKTIGCCLADLLAQPGISE